MKKTILFLTMLLASATFLFAQPTAQMSFPDIQTVPGTVVVPLTVDNISSNLVAGGWFLQFDPAHLTYQSLQYPNADFPQAEWAGSGLHATGNHVGMVWTPGDFTPENPGPGDVLIEVVFDWDGTDTFLGWGTSGSTTTSMFEEDPPGSFNYVPYDLTLIDGSITQLPSEIVWEGDVSDDWFDGFNWAGDVAPTATDDVRIPPGTPFDCQVWYVYAQCANIIVEPDAYLWISEGGMLEVFGDMLMDGIMVFNWDPYAYGWTLNTTGAFLPYGDVNGGGTIVNYRNTLGSAVAGDPNGWHYVSSFMAGQDVTMMMPDYYVNAWDETMSFVDSWAFTNTPNHWVQLAGDPYYCIPYGGDWPTDMDNGRPFSVKLETAYECDAFTPGVGTDVFFYGGVAQFNNGDYPQPYTFTAGGMMEGYNFFGNPYSCGLFTGYFDLSGPIGNDFYVWDEENMSYMVYEQGVVDGTIGMNQGWFMLASGDGVLAVDKTVRDDFANGTFWYKSDDLRIEPRVPVLPDNFLTIRTEGNGHYDQANIIFNDNALAAYDDAYDAKKLFTEFEQVPQIYFPIEGEYLSINGQPAVDFVPMSFTAGVSGLYTIEAIETTTFDYVVLEDLYTGETTDLLSESYEFAYDQNEMDGRFVIHFAPGNFGSEFVNIWSNANYIYVTIPSEVNGDIVVYNMAGQEVLRETAEQGMNIIEMSQNDNYFVVKVIAEEMTETGKVFIK